MGAMLATPRDRQGMLALLGLAVAGATAVVLGGKRSACAPCSSTVPPAPDGSIPPCPPVCRCGG